MFLAEDTKGVNSCLLFSAMCAWSLCKKMMANRQRFTAKDVLGEIMLNSDSEEEQELLDDKLDSNSDRDFGDIGDEEVERRRSQ